MFNRNAFPTSILMLLFFCPSAQAQTENRVTIAIDFNSVTRNSHNENGAIGIDAKVVKGSTEEQVRVLALSSVQDRLFQENLKGPVVLIVIPDDWRLHNLASLQALRSQLEQIFQAVPFDNPIGTGFKPEK